MAMLTRCPDSSSGYRTFSGDVEFHKRRRADGSSGSVEMAGCVEAVSGSLNCSQRGACMHGLLVLP